MQDVQGMWGVWLKTLVVMVFWGSSLHITLELLGGGGGHKL